jgi:hypothetical protein
MSVTSSESADGSATRTPTPFDSSVVRRRSIAHETGGAEAIVSPGCRRMKKVATQQ